MSFRNLQSRMRSIVFAFSILLIVVFFQNCSKGGFEVLPANIQSVNSNGNVIGNGSNVSTSLGPDCSTPEACQILENQASNLLALTSPQLRSNCLSDSSVNACLFFKNPVASRGSIFSVPANSSMDLTSYQKLGVNLDYSTLDSGGCLANSTYVVATKVTITQQVDSSGQTVNSLNGSKYCAPNLNFRVSYLNDSNHNVSAVMAHYYLNFQKNFMKQWTGLWYGTDKGTTVWSYVNHVDYENNACFSGGSDGTGMIIMGGFNSSFMTTMPSSSIQEAALSAEAYLHEAGHANIFYASNIIESSSTHKSCGSSSTCCVSPAGCYAAINEGLADYHSLIIFPNNPIVGEAITNSADGLVEYGLTRDYSKLTNLSASQAYTAPSTKNGEVHALGRIWGSIWYESRKNAKETYGARGVRSLDTVFSKHLLVLVGDDTFKTACAKVVSLAASVDNGLVKSILKNECARRGF